MRSRGLVVAGIVAALAVPVQATAADTSSRTVYVQSFVGPRWQVANVVSDWNRAEHVDVVLVPACLPGHEWCVTVRAYYNDRVENRVGAEPGYGAGWFVQADPARYWITPARPVIELNRAFAGGWRDRRATMCHEMGHALQVGHTGAGCMASFGPGLRWPTPTNLTLAR